MAETGCDLLRPLRTGSRAVIGVLGNSVAWGALVGPDKAWPVLLNRSLRARFGDRVIVYNGAVRASAPDFAGLCWDEIWHSRKAPTLDVAVVDYSVTGSEEMLGALLDRIESRAIPVVGLASCVQPEALTLLQCQATGNADGRCQRWVRAAAAKSDATQQQQQADSISEGVEVSGDDEFWCHRGKGAARGAAAAAHEFARFSRWNVAESPARVKDRILAARAAKAAAAAGGAAERRQSAELEEALRMEQARLAASEQSCGLHVPPASICPPGGSTGSGRSHSAARAPPERLESSRWPGGSPRAAATLRAGRSRQAGSGS